MPPNLGGFFMVRSYYPSECHADYFDFERIEALKPAIEACGISTLSQRSEERRVGKECRSRRSPSHQKKNSRCTLGQFLSRVPGTRRPGAAAQLCVTRALCARAAAA